MAEFYPPIVPASSLTMLLNQQTPVPRQIHCAPHVEKKCQSNIVICDSINKIDGSSQFAAV